MSRSEARKQPAVDVVIPVLNEAHVLENSVRTVRDYLSNNVARFPYWWRILIVDNGSTDGTPKVARRLAEWYSDVAFMQLEQRGRGRALRAAWLRSEADVVCYMDVDLSTDLDNLPELIAAIAMEGYDVATGSRLMSGARVTRSFRREVISQIYNFVVRMVLHTRFSDAQCGFKALSRAAVEQIVPQVEDQSWFFDTELMALAEKQGLRIKDIPVRWIEDDDSRVKILKTGWEDIKGVLRVRRQFSARAVPMKVAGARKREL